MIYEVRLILLVILTAVVSPVAMADDDGAPAKSGSEFNERLSQATQTLKNLGLEPQAVTSVNYHVLYVGREEFAEERRSILEATRRNFLGFMRHLKMPVNEKHGKLLVIVLDTPEQMRNFSRQVEPESAPPEWVAGYYSSKFNWAVFYNQREGDDLVRTEEWLENMARQLIDMPGGPNSMITVNTPQGERRVTKKQLGAEMKQQWRQIINQVNKFNTVVTQHEGAHQIAFNVGVQQRDAAYPFWLSEGLACVFEVPPENKSGAMGAARRNDYRHREYRQTQEQGKLLGVKNLVSLTEDQQINSIGGLYAESWALFSYLFQREPEALSEYMRFLAEKPGRGADELDDPAAAFEKHFQQTLDQIQVELNDYIKRMK